MLNTKEKGKEYKSSLRQEEGTAEARRVQSACSSSNVTDEKNRSPIQQKLDTPKTAFT